MSLNPDAKLLTQRFMEVGEDPQGRFVEKVIEQWKLDSEAATKKRRRMESEHDNLSEEATDIAKQVEDLVLLKKKSLRISGTRPNPLRRGFHPLK